MYSLIQCSTVQCSAVCLCLASITAGAGAPLWYILRLTHIQPTTCQLIHVFFYLYYVNTDIRVCVCRNTRVQWVQSTSCQVIHLFFFGHPSTPIPLSLTVDRTCHFVIWASLSLSIYICQKSNEYSSEWGRGHKIIFIHNVDLKVILNFVISTNQIFVKISLLKS